MNFTYIIIEAARNKNGYRYQLQLIPAAGNQSNGNTNITSPTIIPAYEEIGAAVEVTFALTSAPVAVAA